MLSLPSVLMLIPAEGITVKRLHCRLEGLEGKRFDQAHTRKWVRKALFQGLVACDVERTPRGERYVLRRKGDGGTS